MRARITVVLGLTALPLLVSACATADATGSERTGASATRGLREVAGFVPLWHDDAGRVLLALPPAGEEFLYWVSLPNGLGSNDVGLDRGQLGPRKVVHVERVGARALLVERNTLWRSGADDAAERRAASESFADSILAAFDVLGDDDGRALVDASGFLLRDAHLVAKKLRDTGQGSYALDAGRSVVLAGEAAGFPDNSHVDARLTFAAEDAGPEVASTAADGLSVTLRLRHGFARLPGAGYEPRANHPQSGYWPVAHHDLAAPIDAPLRRAWLPRHRLVKRDRAQAQSAPLEPIVYHVDRGAPEPVRTALVEGARYWERCFEAAGFPGGFRVELLPEGADPHDLRYHVIQWVNRSTRGWSYGETITDPRTGEILKGHVTLGALRVRQDLLLAQGLLGDADDPQAMEMALSRVRQLAAHEVGHTLGLEHNFAASTQDRASVMDYPAPHVALSADGALDLSDAYADGCGAWDEWVIRYGYADFAHTDVGATAAEREERGLAALRAEAEERGLVYLSDEAARGNDRAHPLANLWDDGPDPVEGLAHASDVRRAALARFSPAALADGRPLAELEEVLVPLYLHHRYQLEACVRALGGVEYGYETNDGDVRGTRPVEAARQKRALTLAVGTLVPSFLELPEPLRALIPPRPPGSEPHRELSRPDTLVFDGVALGATSIELGLALLLDPARCTRLVDQHAADADQPGFEGVLDALLAAGWSDAQGDPAGDGTAAALRGELRWGVARHLMRLAADERNAPRLRERAWSALERIGEDEASGALLRATVARFGEDPEDVLGDLRAPRIPPGSPIGCEGPEHAPGFGPQTR